SALLFSPSCPYSSLSVLHLFSFLFTDTATTLLYTLSLHDALPIYLPALTSSYSFAALFGARFAVTETHPVAPCTNDSYVRSSESQNITSSVLLMIILTLRIPSLDSLIYSTLSSS